MPQKSNPVGSEAMVSAARMNAGLLSNMHQALIQEQERGGPGWQLEWLCLPQMAVCTGGALARALSVAEGLEVRIERMRANLDAGKGLCLAEAATFALAAHIPQTEARALVEAACRNVTETGRHLVDNLAAQCDAPVDWDRLRVPANYLGASDALISRALATAVPGRK